MNICHLYYKNADLSDVKALVETQYFIIYKGSELRFVSQKLLEDFKSDDLNDFKEKISHKIDIEKLLSEDIMIKEPIATNLLKDISFHIRSVGTKVANERVILFEPYIKDERESDKLNFIINRISFIELLKDKLIERIISKKTFSIIIISIENIKKLKIDLNEVEIETLVKEFLLQVEVTLENKITLAQYDSDVYIALFEDIKFEDLKIKAQNFYTNISSFIQKQKFSPLVGIYAFCMEKLDLNDILNILENIVTKSLSEEQVSNKNIEYISDIENIMDDKEAIKVLLDSTFTNNTDFKLLNIYKGLCINTSSKIIKKTPEATYIEFELLQGIVMKDEAETVLQSSNFAKDIKATVKYVNLDKHIAILEDFEFLNSNAKARKHSRVTCSTKMLVVILSGGATLNGEVLDISVNSMAIEVKYAKIIDNIKNKNITLTFMLPGKNNFDEPTRLKLEAKVVFVSCDGNDCKMVCELMHEDNSESILMQYVYNRQKEIIIELKKIARKI